VSKGRDGKVARRLCETDAAVRKVRWRALVDRMVKGERSITGFQKWQAHGHRLIQPRASPPRPEVPRTILDGEESCDGHLGALWSFPLRVETFRQPMQLWSEN
jgi:hypothetical protein